MPLKQLLTLKYHWTELSKPETSISTREKQEDQKKVFQLDILLIEEAELEDKTDPESKVVVSTTLETLTMNSKEKGTKTPKNKAPLKSSPKSLKRKPNLRNHKHLLLLSIIKARVLISAQLDLKEKFQSRVKWTLNGWRRKS